MSRRAPAVSVIVPLYNTRAYLGAALESALTQTVSDLEVIVVDDGSTDGGGALAEEFAARDPRVRVVHQSNSGLSAARNTGLELARSDTVAFLDSDDLWLPGKLQRQLPLIDPRTVVHADAFVLRDGVEAREERLMDSVGRMDENDPFGSLLQRNHIAVLTVAASHALLVEHGGFDPALRSAEDYDLWLRLAASGACFSYVPEPLAVYRVRPGSLSTDPVWMARHRLRVYEKLLRDSPRPARKAIRARARRERQLLAGELGKRGRNAIATGDLAGGRSDLAHAVRTAPLWWRSLGAAARLAAASPPVSRRAARPREDG